MKINLKITLIIILLAALSLIGYFYSAQSQTKTGSNKLPSQFKLGLVGTCRKVPDFIAQLNMQQPAIDSKQQGHEGGLLIRDLRNQSHTWKHPSWSQSGFLAAFDRDKNGNTYVAPLPYVSLKKNPPEKQNQIYIIENKTAQMKLYLKMPSTAIPNSNNPFGTMGVFYDCDTNSLYVSSVAGSTPRKENGIIYQIDLKTKKVISQLTHTDAVGIGILNTLKGKKLYFGYARKPYIYSINLDEKGRFIGKKKYELSLSNIQGGDTTVAKKFIFSKRDNKFIMTVKETEFGFRLLAENNPYRKKYHFEYSLSKDKWFFINASQD